MLFQHVGRNTELDGKRIPNGEGVYIEDDRDLDRIYLGKFKRVKNAVGTQILTVNDLPGGPAKRATEGRGVIDGGPSQPTAPNQSLDQRASNSGVKPLRNPGTTGGGGFEGAGPQGGGTQGTRPSPDPEDHADVLKAHKESAKATSKAAKAVLTGEEAEGGSKKKKAATDEHPGWVDVTGEFDKAGKADLAVVKYDDGSFQVFDADDIQNDDAEPLNPTALKTKKAVDGFLDKYKHG